MSQRDDLLTGARQCLVEKGYHRTTARDIAAASGSHLASIGYHFGSKDALMNLAALQAQDEWGDALVAAVRAAAKEDPAQRLKVALEELFASLPRHRELILASVQAYAQAGFTGEIGDALRDATRHARAELAAMLLGRDVADIDTATAETVGMTVHSLVVGFAVQSLIAPDSLPTGDQAVAALRDLVDRNPA
ncbi:TetR/AcrR family transcriptional regulator [Streptomonospora litoralis]|uniref:Transcriptional regulator BetI n=1 Tax=Streptomonospora litoralis TaxID=2498135 RepID=A0A4V0ZJR0_9ACTN|nr:TetR/AcrR family transcriptional regulator [Streptomonospora litoralis]QBI54352.1 transcriptional regulator BetI [Streptomonospora litoralis]